MMCAAREPRGFNEICGICSEREHLSCRCLIQRDRIYFNVPIISSPPQITHSGRGGTGYDLPMSPPSYSGRSGGAGCNIPRFPPQYSGNNNGYDTNEGLQQQYGSRSHRYRAKPFMRHHSGGNGTALSPQQQPAPRPFSSFGGSRGTTAATVQRCGRNNSQAPAPSLALAGSRGTTAATVQRFDRSSSKASAPSVALGGNRGTLAAMDCR